MSEHDPQDDVPPAMRAVLESFISHVIKEAITSANQAIRDAGLVATVSYVRNGNSVELVIRSNLARADHERAEDITDAALQNVLIRASGSRHMLH